MSMHATQPLPLWLRLPERGTAGALALLLRIIAIGGRPLARIFVWPIVVYFFVTSPQARAASRRFLRRVGAQAGTFRHFLTFGRCVIDRLLLLRRSFVGLEIQHGAEDVLDRLRRMRRGALLVGAHVGSFEMLAASARGSGLRVTAVVNNAGSRTFARTAARLDPTIADRVLDCDESPFSAIFEIRRRIERGEHVALLGDRCAPGDRRAIVPFLGSPAALPTGPYELAALLRCPVYFVAGLYLGGRRYEIHAELLADAIALPRHDRAAALATWARRYARRLERLAVRAPLNWFNFYDFWEGGRTGGEPARDC